MARVRALIVRWDARTWKKIDWIISRGSRTSKLGPVMLDSEGCVASKRSSIEYASARTAG